MPGSNQVQKPASLILSTTGVAELDCCWQGLSMEAIASQRAVQLSTVQSYIAEAMAAGYSYAWHRMGIPFCILASLCGHVRAYHKQQLLPEEQQQQAASDEIQGCLQHQAGSANLPHESHSGPQAALIRDGLDLVTGQLQQTEKKPLQHRQLPGLHVQLASSAQQHQEGCLLTQVAAANTCHQCSKSLGQQSMQGQDRCSQCGLLQEDPNLKLHPSGLIHLNSESSIGAHEIDQLPVQLPDMQLTRQMVLTSKGTKALRDSMVTCLLTYGHMRLGLAHVFCLLRHHVCACCLPDLTAG